MSLWNDIKGWFDKKEPQKDTKPLTQEKTIDTIFDEVCFELGIGSKILAQTSAKEKFCAWYSGPCNKKDAMSAMPSFLESCYQKGAHYQKLKRFIK